MWKLALLLPAAAFAPAVSPGDDGLPPYRCSVIMEVAGLSGGMWRDFYPGAPDEFYIVQLHNPAVGSSLFASWGIDNRPPAPPRVYGYRHGRPEADVFRQGPDHVNFGVIDHGRVPDGRIWARLFGDGAYAGVFLAQSARRTRAAYRRGATGVWVSVNHRQYGEMLERLAHARDWRAVLVDETGRELGGRTVRVPVAAEIEAAFTRARAEMLRHRDAFVAAGGFERSGAPCAIHPPDDAII